MRIAADLRIIIFTVGGGHYSVLTRNKYSSSFQKFYRPNSAVSYHHSRIYQPGRRPVYQYNPQSYQPRYHRHHRHHHLQHPRYGPAYYHYQPYTQPHYYAWLGAIKFNSDLRTTTEKITTTTDQASIQRNKKNFNVSMTASKSIVSESHTVTVSTTSVVTSISSTISIKQLSTTTSSRMTSNSTVGDLSDLRTTEGVFLVYPAVDDTGIDDGLTESSPPETTSAMTTLKPLSLTYRYRENKNIFGLLSQLNQSVSSLCKYSLVKRICTMRNIVY